jgi:hypothetical protein
MSASNMLRTNATAFLPGAPLLSLFSLKAKQSQISSLLSVPAGQFSSRISWSSEGSGAVMVRLQALLGESLTQLRAPAQ